MRKLAAVVVAAFALMTAAHAIEEGRLTLVVGFASGGTSSTAARIIADSVGQIAGTTPMVENKPGAGGALALAGGAGGRAARG